MRSVNSDSRASSEYGPVSRSTVFNENCGVAYQFLLNNLCVNSLSTVQWVRIVLLIVCGDSVCYNYTDTSRVEVKKTLV